MKLTKEQLADIRTDIDVAKKTVSEDASLSKLIAAVDEKVTALLAHIAEMDKELAELKELLEASNRAIGMLARRTVNNPEGEPINNEAAVWERAAAYWCSRAKTLERDQAHIATLRKDQP